MTLKFGVLKGLRFDMVIGLYAISFHFMEVIQDLLTLQLEDIESKNPELALLYGQPQQSFLAMMSSPGNDDSRSSTPVSVGPIHATIPLYILPAADRPAMGLRSRPPSRMA
jgi:hypothetical protein